MTKNFKKNIELNSSSLEDLISVIYKELSNNYDSLHDLNIEIKKSSDTTLVKIYDKLTPLDSEKKKMLKSNMGKASINGLDLHKVKEYYKKEGV